MAKKILIVVGVVVVAFVAWSFFSGKFTKKEDTPIPKDEVKTPVAGKYESPSYSFSFIHGDKLEVKEKSPTEIAIVDSESGRTVAEVHVVVEEGDAEAPYEQFVLDEARAFCGKAGSAFSCTEVKDLVLTTNQKGLPAQKFFLVLEETAGNSVSKKDKGPFYTFNFSENTPGKMSFVFVHPPIDRTGSIEAIETVAKTLEF